MEQEGYQLPKDLTKDIKNRLNNLMEEFPHLQLDDVTEKLKEIRQIEEQLR
ncbi:hypothetical protein [Marinifilum sp.]|uniref:hypothetical protein n=1 Tax=Marinifilum sp. TaxID=2033137 RepID=UPI003BAB7049